jgi:2-keto-4-pentenoate hydratase/2-oxohepta-3-ene-1,7-dioic acid hydratase in catechol pathway
MHYEVELALVIGKLTRDLQASDTQGALEAVEGNAIMPCIYQFAESKN